MKEKIEKILKEKNLYKAPVDIVKLAESYGISIFQQEIEYDGAIISRNEDFEISGEHCNKAIIININQSPARKRFTIAHELAHWIQTPEQQKNNLYAHRDDNLTRFNYEPEINAMASEILMPHGLVKDVLQNTDYKQRGIYPRLINYVANMFNVSYSAAQVRLKKFELGA